MKALAALALAGLLAGCGGEKDPRGPLSVEERLNPEACAECHPEHHREWSGSMHAYAAEDPVFRAMNARGQRETNGALGDLCIRCHAPLAVEMGLTTDGLNLDEIPAHLRGITCAFCHTVTGVDGEANNPLVRTDDGVMRGGIADPLPNPAHGSVRSDLHDGARLRSGDLCGPCHDVVTPAGVHLERTFAEWKAAVAVQRSAAFQNSCVACHMPGRDDVAADFEGVGLRRVHDHSWPGVDVALTDFPERQAQREKVQRSLDSTLLAELCVVEASGGADVEVYLENVGAGHAFPSGAAQDRRLWLRLKATAGAETLLDVGDYGDDEDLPEPGSPEAADLWVFRDVMYDAAGELTHAFWKAARVETNLLPAPSGALPGEPGYVNQHVPRRYRVVGAVPDRVEMAVRLRPMGLEVLRELVLSGDLDPAVVAAMPTFTLASTVLVWTREAAEERISALSDRPALCVGLSGQSRAAPPPAP